MFYFIDYVVIVIYIIFGNRFSYKRKKKKNINLVKTYYLQLNYIKNLFNKLAKGWITQAYLKKKKKIILFFSRCMI
jgi:hypothetical protein